MSARGGTRIIGYFTKGTRPNDPKKAWGLQTLAFQTVKSLGIDAKEILLRGEIHDTTTVGGKTVKDPGGFHFTLSIRSEENIKNNTFISAHAYTSGKNDFTLKNATLAANPLPLTATGRANKRIWPENITEEEVFYVDPPTEPELAPEAHAMGSGGNVAGTGGHAPSTGAHATGHTPSTAAQTPKSNPGFLSAVSSGLAPTVVSAMIGGNVKGKKGSK